MDHKELKRYGRQMVLPELGIDGQQRLKAASALVIGAGGLGSPLLFYLASAGVGRIGIADHDAVEESNLHRQILFATGDIGKNKAHTAVNRLQLLNPYIQLIAYAFKVDKENAGSIIKDYDLVIDGSDNFGTRYLVNDACVLLNKPLVFGAIFKFEGQVSVFNYDGGPDYRSLFPEPPAAEEVPDCNTVGVIGTLPGIIGSYMANEAIKLICGFGEILSGKLLVFNALDNSSLIFSLSRKNADAISNSSSITDRVDPIDDMGKKQINLAGYEQLKKHDHSVFLIDVREEYEYEEYNIGGLNIPLYELNEHIGSIPIDKKIVLCCTSGSRSRMAFKLLRNKINNEILILGLNL